VNIYCLRCRKRQEVGRATVVTLKNGRAAYTSQCPECGCKLFKFSKGEIQKVKKAITPIEKLSRAVDNTLLHKPKLHQKEIAPDVAPEKAAPEEPVAVEKGPIKATSKRKWKLLIIGGVLTALGIGMMLLYGQDRHNVFFAFLTIMALPAGIYLLYRGWRGGETGSQDHRAGKQPQYLPGQGSV
jgi:predicted  nucleic acid-binding Zn-ribbon protein